MVKRYVDLYRAARVMTGLGATVKIIGMVLGGLIFMFWFIVGIVAASPSQSSSPFGPSPGSVFGVVGFFFSMMAGLAFGALVGGLFFLLGVLISAQGQLLMATADSAVCASPFLSDQERAAAMSLPDATLVSAPANV
jgi:hypothetical protein